MTALMQPGIIIFYVSAIHEQINLLTFLTHALKKEKYMWIRLLASSASSLDNRNWDKKHNP